MVQIIQSGPTEQTLRQRAFNQGISQLGAGLGGFFQQQKQDEKDAVKTLRQQALQDRQAGIQNIDLALKLTQASGQKVTAEQAGQLISGQSQALQEGESEAREPFGGVFGGIAERSAEEREIKKEQRRQNKELREAQIQDLKNKPFRERKKAEKAQKTEDAKLKRSTNKDLTQRKVKLQKEYSGLDRVFGNMDALKKKFATGGKLSASDQFQLVRSFVPLSEIRPGVVRDAEFATTRELGGKFGSLEVLLGNITKGQLLSTAVIKEMFDSADTLKDVVNRGKESRFGDIEDEAISAGFSDKEIDLVLGEIGRRARKRRVDRANQEQEEALTRLSPQQDRGDFLDLLIPSAQAGQVQVPLLQRDDPDDARRLLDLRSRDTR